MRIVFCRHSTTAVFPVCSAHEIGTHILQLFANLQFESRCEENNGQSMFHQNSSGIPLGAIFPLVGFHKVWVFGAFCLDVFYRVAKTHRIPYLCRSFPAKELYNHWLICGNLK